VWEKWRIPAFFKHAVPIMAVIFMFVLFRAESMGQFFEVCKNMFGLNNNGFFSDTALMIWKEYGIVFVVGIAFLFPLRSLIEKKITMKSTPAVLRVLGGAVYLVAILGLFTFCVIVLAKGGYNPFIYFNF
jgi:alginate O-acetyltransferase complex protein AlgI